MENSNLKVHCDFFAFTIFFNLLKLKEWLSYKFTEDLLYNERNWITVKVQNLSKGWNRKRYSWRDSWQILAKRGQVVSVLCELELSRIYKVKVRYKDIARFFFCRKLDEFANLWNISAPGLLKTLISDVFSERTPHLSIHSHFLLSFSILLHYTLGVPWMNDTVFEDI